jgi:hypothetical protein
MSNVKFQLLSLVVQLLLQHSLSLTLFFLQLSEQQVILTHLSLQLE